MLRMALGTDVTASDPPWEEVVTTAVESLEALHLWLAERLMELRLVAEEADAASVVWSAEEWERGWVPNVTTDGLLEALGGKFVRIHTLEGIASCRVTVGATYEGRGKTPHEALCRAARKALE